MFAVRMHLTDCHWLNTFKISRNTGIYQEMSLRRGPLTGHQKHPVAKETVTVAKEHFRAYHRLNFMTMVLPLFKTGQWIILAHLNSLPRPMKFCKTEPWLPILPSSCTICITHSAPVLIPSFTCTTPFPIPGPVHPRICGFLHKCTTQLLSAFLFQFKCHLLREAARNTFSETLFPWRTPDFLHFSH